MTAARTMAKRRLAPSKVLAVAATLLIVAAVGNRVSSDGQVRVLGHVLTSAPTDAMSPQINSGDLAVESPVTGSRASHLHPGQIISFRSELHGHQVRIGRIVSVAFDGSGAVTYVTKGDANAEWDIALAPAADVVGLHQSTVPYGGYVISALGRPLTVVLLSLLVLVWLGSGPLRQRAREETVPRPQELAFEDR